RPPRTLPDTAAHADANPRGREAGLGPAIRRRTARGEERDRPNESSAPTASTESPSAGVESERGFGPSLPAAVTTRMPRCAAMSAATVVTAISPFNWDGV